MYTRLTEAEGTRGEVNPVLGLGLSSSASDLIDRELIVRTDLVSDSSIHNGPMGHIRGLPLVAGLDVLLRRVVDESKTSPRRVRIDEADRPSLGVLVTRPVAGRATLGCRRGLAARGQVAGGVAGGVYPGMVHPVPLYTSVYRPRCTGYWTSDLGLLTSVLGPD